MYALKGAGKERNMKKNFEKKRMKNKVMVIMSLFLFTTIMLSGCGEADEREKQRQHSRCFSGKPDFG